MTSRHEKKKATAATVAIKNRNTIYQKDESVNTSISHTADSGEYFDETLTVEARFAGGTITLEPEHVEWIGETLVRVEIPGCGPVMLRTFEARDLAVQLLNQAAHIDEEPREIRRCTVPGSPAFEEAI